MSGPCKPGKSRTESTRRTMTQFVKRLPLGAPLYYGTAACKEFNLLIMFMWLRRVFFVSTLVMHVYSHPCVTVGYQSDHRAMHNQKVCLRAGGADLNYMCRDISAECDSFEFIYILAEPPHTPTMLIFNQNFNSTFL